MRVNGNLVSKTGDDVNTAYTWDWNNRLLSVSQADMNTVYEYDGDGTRISKTQDEVKIKYINDVARGLVQVLMETTDTNMVQTTYTYGNDLISAQIGEIRGYYHYDGLGSTRQLTDNSGTVTKSYTYDSFGNVIASTGTSVNAYGFTGEQQLEEPDDLVFLRARYYEPRIGRFLSPDTFGMIPQGKKRNRFSPFLRYTDGMNLYVYVKNNPMNFTDPSGAICCDGEGLAQCFMQLYQEILENLPAGAACVMFCSDCLVGSHNPWACVGCGGCVAGLALRIADCFGENCSF